MKRIFTALYILVVCTLPVGDKAAGTDPTPIVFTHVSVVPMDGDRILPDQDVTIRGQLIASVEPAASASLPKDACAGVRSGDHRASRWV